MFPQMYKTRMSQGVKDQPTLSMDLLNMEVSQMFSSAPVTAHEGSHVIKRNRSVLTVEVFIHKELELFTLFSFRQAEGRKDRAGSLLNGS